MFIIAFLFLLLVFPFSTGLRLFQPIRHLSNTQLHFDFSDDGEKSNYPHRKEKISVANEALLHFDRHSNCITTQQQVDDFYKRKWRRKDLKTTWNTSLGTFSNVEGTDAVICILENAPWYQKYHNIKFLGGPKTRFVRSVLEANLEYLDHIHGPHLHRAVVSTLYSLIAVPSVADATILLSVAIKLLLLAHKHDIYFNGKDIAKMLYGLQVKQILYHFSTDSLTLIQIHSPSLT